MVRFFSSSDALLNSHTPWPNICTIYQSVYFKDLAAGICYCKVKERFSAHLNITCVYDQLIKNTTCIMYIYVANVRLNIDHSKFGRD